MTEINKYNKTIFYKIVCKDENIKDMYVGHTTDYKSRISCHKHYCYNPNRKHYNIMVYHFIRENGGWDNFKMVIIEERNLNNRREAETHEGYLINILGAKLNTLQPGKTLMQLQEECKHRMKANSRKYYELNKERLRESHKQYWEDNIEQLKASTAKPYECPYCNCSVRWGDKSKHFKTKKHQQAVTASSEASELSEASSLPSLSTSSNCD